MNTLTLFLYVADILPSLGKLLVVIGVASLVLLSVTALVHLISTDTSNVERKKWHLTCLYNTLKLMWLPALLLAVSCFFPSKETLYLMAGSEVGEMVFISDEAKAIYGDIRAVIQGYIPKPE